MDISGDFYKKFMFRSSTDGKHLTPDRENRTKFVKVIDIAFTGDFGRRFHLIRLISDFNNAPSVWSRTDSKSYGHTLRR